MVQNRATAYIFWIKDIVNAVPEITPEGFRVFGIHGRQAKRVNVISAVIGAYQNEPKTYSALTLDDGSGQIRVKAWDEDTKAIAGVSVGDIALVVGLLHESNGEIFIRPELARKLGVEWASARKSGLLSSYGKAPAEGRLNVTEELVGEPVEPTMEARGKVLSLIESQGQVAVEDLIKISGMRRALVEKVVEELIKDGEIFQPKAGFVQVL
ncbi:MAG TPA: hypothetical protein HA362_00285 [Nanoarchaeota archaeon]|nr:hypothetical protein [Nanoarchaeota archaeon]